MDVSMKDDPDTEFESGYAAYCGYNGKKNDFDWSLSCSRRSKDFSADMGRVFQTDYSSINLDVYQETEPNGKIVKKYGSSLWLFKSVFNEGNKLFGQSVGMNIWANSQYKMNFSINANMGQENYEDSIYDWDFIYVSIGSWDISWLGARINYSMGNSLVYSFAKMFKNDNVGFSIWGDIGSNLSYSASTHKTRYFNFPVDSGMDDEYWIGNTDLTINFSNKLSLKNGLRYSSYECDDLTAYVGVFSNLRFEFKDDCYLFVGYKTAQDEIKKEYITDYKQVYMKVSYTF